MLLVDIDGVISLWGFDPNERPEGTWHQVEGITHFLSATAIENLHDLADCFDLAWCSGWEEKAGEHLPALVGAPAIPHLSFEQRVGGSDSGHAHWKLAAIEDHAGDRPLAWIDDALDDACEAWAARRGVPTLLVHTDPAVGLTSAQAEDLRSWARAIFTTPASPDRP